MPIVLRVLVLAALLTLVPVGIGVFVSNDRTPTRAPAAYTGTDLADFEPTAAVVRRAPFCALIPSEAVDAALDGPGDLTSYDNGQETDVLPGTDVAHEFGCRFTADGDASAGEARAWVFAPPVTAERAQALVKDARSKRCEVDEAAPAYGTPSVAVTCMDRDLRTVAHRGLYGDAWLACSLSLPAGVPPKELAARAGRWCVAVAQAASAPTS